MNKATVLICSDKPWGQDLKFTQNFLDEFDVKMCRDRKSLNSQLEEFDSPVWIFFCFWSSYVRPEVFLRNKAVIFHMTDLPFGRGGSPLQNLILKGHKFTKLSAIRCEEEVDSGDIYIQKELSLTGSAQEIYNRAASMMPELIEFICKEKPVPKPQEGSPEYFTRRSPDESRIPGSLSLEELYDFIRMLDADSYPRAFLDIGAIRLEFSNANVSEGILSAAVTAVRNGD